MTDSRPMTHEMALAGGLPRALERGDAGPMIDEIALAGGPPRALERAVPCEVPGRECAATLVLAVAGPVRVPFRLCCTAALLRSRRLE
jgi:hypothetical protein